MTALKRIIKSVWLPVHRFLIRCGFDLRMRAEDRRVLETIIFPYFAARPEFHKILFVGCEWFSKGYRKEFRQKDYSTIDIDPEKARYGAKRHIVDSVENVRRHFPENSLDLIICNGVFGWGLNERAQVEAAFRNCRACLREGGVLMVGWNDVPEYRPFPLEECESLKLFQPYVFPPLGTAQYLSATPYRHTYNFYLKA